MRGHETEHYLSTQEERVLLRLARATLEAYVRHRKTIDPTAFPLTEALQLHRGAFVTLRKADELRGCIGSTANLHPLAFSVRDSTMNSSANDPRFDPVVEFELPEIRIEISALTGGDEPETPFRRIEEIEEIVIGRDGLFVKRPENRGGLLLPQVPVDHGWDLRQYLGAVCRKAGYAETAWQQSDTELYRFSAQVFSED